MEKDRKQLENQMSPAGQEECFHSNDLFAVATPVWYQSSGKVNPEWLSICKEEQNQTTNLLEQVISFSNLQKAYKQVRSNGGSAGIDKMSVKDFGDWFCRSLPRTSKGSTTRNL